MEKYQLSIRKDYYFSSIHHISRGEELVKQLSATSERPDAILCANDLVAAGILAEAKRQNWNIPEDLAIIGFDNHDISRVLNMTTIHNPIKEQAENAFYLLAKDLLGEEKTLLTPTFELIHRATT
jgi:DNA-binding LacI/PurR family transcriptional regulator